MGTFKKSINSHNSLLKNLTEICQKYTTEEKILIVSSFSQGHQIAESLVRSGTPFINLRYKTPLSLAHETIDLDISKQSLTFLPDSSMLIVIEEIYSLLHSDENSYFNKLAPKEGIIGVITSAIKELRMCGIKSKDIFPEQFINKKKGSEIKKFLDTYEKYLSDKKLVDTPEVLSLAIDKISGKTGANDNKLNLILSDIPLSPLEKKIIDLLPDKKILLPSSPAHGLIRPERYLPVQEEEESPKALTNIERMAWLFSPEDSPDNFKDSTVQIFHSVGRRNEIREVIRRIISFGTKCDEVEIITAEYSDYVPLIYSTTKKFDIDVTFAGGLPVLFTHVGQALKGFLLWISSGYEAVKLRKLIMSGNISIHKDADKEISASLISQILRESPIGWGKERYNIVLTKQADYYASRATKSNESGEKAYDFFKRKELNARFFIKMMEELLQSIPDEDKEQLIELKGLCKAVADFIARYARISDNIDVETINAVKGRLEEIHQMTSQKMPLQDAVSHIETIISQLRIAGSGPQPGHIHVSSYKNGGYSGRPNTFIVGCESQYFPGTSMQDPIMLDEERANLNKDLISSSERLKENLFRMASMISSLNGNVTFSFSSFDVIENRESFPSSLILQVYRLISGKNEADYSELMKFLGSPVGYVPLKDLIDITDFWTEQIVDDVTFKNAAKSIPACYPGLAQGITANNARYSDKVTEYDGKLMNPNADLDPRENNDLVMSASRLETLSKCPYSYFLNYVLKIRPEEELTYTMGEWLNALDRGSLLHEIFYEFMKEIKEINEKPSVEKHAQVIRKIAEDIINKYREEIPAPGEAIFEQERKALLRTTEIFLSIEEEYCKENIPEFFEVPFGCTWDENETGLKHEDPVTIQLNNGKGFKFRGKIDRIDKTEEHKYIVWDYKTGSDYGFKDHGYFSQGKQLQHALYSMAAEIILRTMKVNKAAEVAGGGYLFPTEKGTGKRYLRTRRDNEFKDLLDSIFEVIHKGMFLPADKNDPCKYCDYIPICGNNATEQSKQKINNADNAEVNLIKKIKEYD